MLIVSMIWLSRLEMNRFDNRGTSCGFSEISRKQLKDINILALFVYVFCKDHHSGITKNYYKSQYFKAERDYCPACTDFLEYAIGRRLCCPLPSKSSCKKCHVHCYRPGHREKVKEIMRYSGRKLITRGRFDLLIHYLF